jgi:hypothetical protein
MALSIERMEAMERVTKDPASCDVCNCGAFYYLTTQDGAWYVCNNHITHGLSILMANGLVVAVTRVTLPVK